MPKVDWRELYKRFDPEAPALPQFRVDREDSPVARIAQRLDSALTDAPVLFIGTVGTGKTTELLRLAERRSSREFVVFLDLVRHFDEVVVDLPALERVQAWEVCFLAGLAVWRAAEDVLGHRWEPKLAARLKERWQQARKSSDMVEDAGATFEVGGLAKAMIVMASPVAGAALDAGLKALEAAAEGLSWSLPIGRGGRDLPDQHSAMQALLACVNEIIEVVAQAYDRRVLLVIDGLDRIRDEKKVRALFLESQMLARFACPSVLCAPNLRRDLMTAQLRRFSVEVLVNEPVLDHADPRRPGPGIDFFRQIFRERAQGLDPAAAPSSEAVERLGYYSGGQARMFIKLVRSLAEKVVLERAEAPLQRHVEAAIDEQRRLLEMGLHRGHISLLQQVIEDPAHQLPDDDRVWDLLASLRLLPYPNRSEWYYPHPLLMGSLLRAPSLAGASG